MSGDDTFAGDERGRAMLVLHEVHRVRGRREADFEAAFRDGWAARLAEDGGARLLYYLEVAHGAGPSYQVLTYTAVADGAAWERLARRVQRGDLRAWMRDVDVLRHDVTARLLAPLPWAPPMRYDDVPAQSAAAEPALFMEDTMRPLPGRAAAYVEAAGQVYRPMLERGGGLLTVAGAFQTLPGGGPGPEVTLLQRVNDTAALIRLLTTDPAAEHDRPGSWMHDALDYRDQWRSKLLRTAPWSPLA